LNSITLTKINNNILVSQVHNHQTNQRTNL